MAEALYRKYRPQVFEDVVGQEHIQRTLKNAIASDKVSHAYLFTGPRGTGKTTTARLLAKALICEKGPTPDPDGTCEDCRLIADGEHPDVYELDAASRTGVDNVREEIIGRVNYAPTRGRYKVYIIDEVHMLSVQAFNALLKTLEEPPSHVVFVLCTTDPQKVPETIHSRCQRFDFRRISSEELVSRLGAICEMEGIPFEGDALELVAHRAQGGMRDALTSLEQLIAFSEGNVTMVQAERLLGSLDSTDMAEIMHAVGTRDAAACFRWTSEYMETGADLAQFTQDMAEHVRNMYVMSLTDADIALDVTDAARRELHVELEMFGPDRLSRMLGVLADLMADLKTSTNQRLSFEIALTRMVRPESDLTLEALAERLEALERSGIAAVAASSQAVMQGTAQPAASAVDAGASSTRAASQAQSASTAPAVRSEVHEVPAQAAAPAASVADAAAIGVVGMSAQELAAKDITQLWDAVMAQLKRISEAHGVLFMNARPAWDVPGEAISISFNPENKFAFQSAQKEEARTALQEALSKVGAASVRFIVKQADAADASSAQAAAKAQPAVVAQPVVASDPVVASQTVAAQEPASAFAAPVAQDAQSASHAAAHPASQPEPEPAPAERAVERSAHQSAPAEPEAPEFEQVPYEDLVGSAAVAPEEDVPFDTAPDASVDTAASAASSDAVPDAPFDVASDAAADDSSDLNDILAGAFGAEVKFTEVD